jgi:hypothetical protein
MARGVKTGGRKAGTLNKTTVERAARARAGVKAAISSGVMPLDIILAVARGGPEADAVTDRQLGAAIAAAPYLHPRLSSTTADVSVRADPAALSDAELTAIAVRGSG